MKKVFKNSIVMFLTSLILVNVLSSFFVLTTFFSNQDYFVQNFCVNKARPTLCCKGSCHLDKILKVTDEGQSGPKSLKISALSFEYVSMHVPIVFELFMDDLPTVFGELEIKFSSVDLNGFSPPPKS